MATIWTPKPASSSTKETCLIRGKWADIITKSHVREVWNPKYPEHHCRGRRFMLAKYKVQAWIWSNNIGVHHFCWSARSKNPKIHTWAHRNCMIQNWICRKDKKSNIQVLNLLIDKAAYLKKFRMVQNCMYKNQYHTHYPPPNKNIIIYNII